MLTFGLRLAIDGHGIDSEHGSYSSLITLHFTQHYTGQKLLASHTCYSAYIDVSVVVFTTGRGDCHMTPYSLDHKLFTAVVLKHYMPLFKWGPN